jgi:hypothetical protein
LMRAFSRFSHSSCCFFSFFCRSTSIRRSSSRS